MKFLIIILWPLLALSQNESWRVLQKQEAELGALEVRQSTPVLASTLEIPLEALRGLTYLPESEIPGILMAVRNGEPYFRWILDPEDRTYGDRLQNYLRDQKISFFRGPKVAVYSTASRSYFFWDPKTNNAYTFKTSTDRVGAQLQEKFWKAEEAFDSVTVSEYLKNIPLNRSLIVPDTLSMAIGGFGWSLRDYQFLKKSKRRYIPLFLIFNEDYLRELMSRHNETDPHRFVKESIVKPYAQAYAEFVAHTGLMMDSPHSQNILIELDERGRNTGRLMNWFNIFHHVKTPKWIRYDDSGASMRDMVQSYYDTFNQEFLKISGFQLPPFMEKVSHGQKHFAHESQIPAAVWSKLQRKNSLRCEGNFL